MAKKKLPLKSYVVEYTDAYDQFHRVSIEATNVDVTTDTAYMFGPDGALRAAFKNWSFLAEVEPCGCDPEEGECSQCTPVNSKPKTYAHPL